MATTFLPAPYGIDPELIGDYISGKTPGRATKARRLPGATYEGVKVNKTPVSYEGKKAPVEPPKRLPPPKGAIPKGKPPMGSMGATTALSLLGSAAPQGTVGSPFIASPVGVTKEQMQNQVVPLAQEQLKQRAEKSPVVAPFVPKSSQSRTPQVPEQVTSQVKADVEAGKVTGKEYTDAAVQKAELESVLTTGKPLSQKEKQAVVEKESSFWNQLGIDGKTAALIGVGLAATAKGYGKGGFEQGIVQGFDMMNQAIGRRDARMAQAAQAEQQAAQFAERMNLERDKLALMEQRMEAEARAKGNEKPESVATKQSRPQIETGVVDVMEALELTPSSFFGMGGGNLPNEETYKRLKTDFTDYVYRKRTEGDTRGTQELITERYQQLAGQ